MKVALAEIDALERRIEQAAASGLTDDLDVLGYGEVTIAVRLSSSEGDLACKRLVPFRSREAAEEAAGLIERYIRELTRCGLDVVPTSTPILKRSAGHVLYCVQPMLDAKTLGPEFLREKTAAEAIPHVRRIFGHIAASVTPRLAPDGQLSNWAFDGERLRYLDVGTPFLRDAAGNELFDFSQQTTALPAPIRLVVDRLLVRGILDNYHSIRGQALDFLGNLIKEGLGHLLSPLIPLANEVFALDREIVEDEIRAHYKRDALTYALVQGARRADRWMHHKVLRRPYPFLLPPRIARFG